MKASNETLNKLHQVLADTFLELIENGDAAPATLNAARQFLRDNNIQDVSPTSSVWSMKDHMSKIPFPTNEELVEEAR